MTLIDKLLRLASLWAEANQRSTSRLATIVVNDGKLFDRLEQGATCTVATYERLIRWLAEPTNWSGDTLPPAAIKLVSNCCVTTEADNGPGTTQSPSKSREVISRSGEPARC